MRCARLLLRSLLRDCSFLILVGLLVSLEATLGMLLAPSPRVRFVTGYRTLPNLLRQAPCLPTRSSGASSKHTPPTHIHTLHTYLPLTSLYPYLPYLLHHIHVTHILLHLPTDYLSINCVLYFAVCVPRCLTNFHSKTIFASLTAPLLDCLA